MRFASFWQMIGVLSAMLLQAQTTSSQRPLARIGSQEIYEQDLLPSIGAQLHQLRNQEYELKLGALTNLLNQKVLDEEAKKDGLTVDELWQQAVDRKVLPPGELEVEAYYLAQKDRISRPLSEVRAQLERALAQAKLQQARQAYLEQLRKRAGVTVLLRRPRVEVAVDPTRLRGNPQAPVTIVEFGDFQCPYCRAVQPTLKQLLEKYPGKVRLAFRDFPLLQIHPQAEDAAEAARCAGEQGEFWNYHDLLYANQSRLDRPSLLQQARGLGLNSPAFQACLDSGRFRPAVESDLQAGAAAGVSATPTFFVNGVLLTGAQPLAAFEKIFEPDLIESPPLTEHEH